MKKTSVYLTEDEASDLRRLAVREGKPQAELIREGIRRVIDDASATRRVFRSLGKGRGDGRPHETWNADELYREVMGRE